MDEEREPGKTWSFEYGELKNVDRSYREFAVPGRLTFEPVKEAVVAYCWNMERVGYLATLVTDALFHSTAANRFVPPEVPIAIGEPVRDMGLWWFTTPDQAAKYRDDYNEYLRSVRAQGSDFYDNRRWELGSGIIDLVGDEGVRNRPLGHGVEATYCAMILNAYAALETLAGDLWVACVNQQPDLIPVGKEEDQGRMIDFRALKSFGYNTEGKVGSFLLHAEKVSFQSRKSILRAYESVFGKTSKEYNAFTKNADLLKCEKARHLIAHKGGRADAKFINEVKGWGEFNGTEEGKHIPLTGKTVCALINPCVKTAVDLILSVDERTSRYGQRNERVDAGANPEPGELLS